MTSDPLLAFLRRRTRRRFEALVRDTHTSVSRAAWRVLGDAELAEDVAQEVYMKVLEDDWDPRRIRSGHGWLATTAVQLARTRLRGVLRQKAREERAVATRNEVSDADLEAVRDAVLALPDDLRQTVELRYFGALAVGEVAAALDLTPRAVNKRLQAARAKLQKRLAPSQLGCLVPVLESTAPAPIPEASFGEPTWLPSACAQALATGRLVAGSSGPLAASWVGAVLAVLLLGGVTRHLVGLGDRDPTPRETAGLAAPGPGRDAAAASGAAGLRGRPRPTSEAPPRKVGPAADVASGPGAVVGYTVPEKAPLAPFALRLRVVDERGELLCEGAVTLEPLRNKDGERLFAVQNEWMRFRSVSERPNPLQWLQEPIDLEEHNPLVIEDLAGELEGVRLRVSANVPGYAADRLPHFEVEAGGHGEVVLRLVPARAVEVRIVDARTSEPVPAAVITSVTELARRPFGAGTDREPPAPGQGVSDEEGRCSLGGLGPGAHVLRIERAGYVRAEVTSAQSALSTEVRLRPVRDGAHLRVHVVDPDGGPVPDLRVRLGYGVGTRTVRTNANGLADFGILPAMRAWVTILPQDWVAFVNERRLEFGKGLSFQNIALEAGRTLDVALGYPQGGASIAVELVDESGAPVVGAEIQVRGPGRGEARTDENGRARIDALPAGDYDVSARWSRTPLRSVDESPWDWDWTWSDWHVAEDGLLERRVVVGTRRIEGRVVSAYGDELSSPTVHIVGEKASTSPPIAPDGRFRAEGVAAGIYRLFAFDQNGHLSREIRVEVERGRPVPPVKLVLAQGGAIEIRLAGRSDAQLAGVRATLQAEGEEPIAVGRAAEGAATWTAPWVWPGRYTLVLEVPGEARHEREVLVEDRKTLVVEH